MSKFENTRKFFESAIEGIILDMIDCEYQIYI